MPTPHGVTLQPLTRKIVVGSYLERENAFPSNQAWADDTEKILSFLVACDQFGRFLPRLRKKERDPALAEARVAFYLRRSGFEIVSWEPKVTKKPGDLEVAVGGEDPLFIEVKSPGWDGELSLSETRAGRNKQPKYKHAETRAFDTTSKLVAAVRKALPKFGPGRANLVAIADDLFVSPLEAPAVVAGELRRALQASDMAAVSGVLMVQADCVSQDSIRYRSAFVKGNGPAIPPLSLDLLCSSSEWDAGGTTGAENQSP